jgi:Helix-turn-helix domain
VRVAESTGGRPAPVTPLVACVNAVSPADGGADRQPWEGTFRKNSFQELVETMLSSVVFRNMSSEPVRDDAAEGKRLFLTDPKAIRALAHPLRVALLELFGVHSTLTATQASEILGESPANCAFHLRTLAKYGFVEEAGGGRGRERPWRAVNTSIALSQDKLEDEQARVAADALSGVWLDSWLGRIRKVVGSRRWPAEWEESSGSMQSLVFLSPDEAVALREEFRVLVDRYMPRRDDPSQRPAGAVPVEISTFYFPREDLALPLGQPGDDGADEGDEGEG